MIRAVTTAFGEASDTLAQRVAEEAAKRKQAAQ